MKIKAKFDLAGMLNVLFEHGEKILFGMTALVFLMFVYSAATREVLDASKQPDRLLQVARQVETHVTSSVRDERNVGVQVVDYLERANRREVPLAAFAIHTPLNNPIFDPKGKRDDPKILNVEDIRVAAGFGTFALLADGPSNAATAAAGSRGSGQQRQGGGRNEHGIRPSQNANLKPQPWAVVTALVPAEKQAQAYAEAFSRAMGGDPSRDVPKYAGWKLERAEIDPANPNKLDWQEVDSNEAYEKKWETQSGEIVAAAYVDARLTSPLGPLVYSNWDASVSHPRILLSSEAETRSTTTGATTTTVSTTATVADQPSLAGYKLLRVFDYSVKPKHEYRYRVKLSVQNPNYGRDRKFLKKPDAPTNGQETRASDEWSEPTGAITIPSGYGVLAGTVEPKLSEPVARVLLTSVGEGDGIPASTEVKVYRGSVANKREPNVQATDPRNTQTVKIEEVDFQSNFVVVDIFGGNSVSLSKRKESPITAPGELLLVDVDGNLVVRSELDDLADYEFRGPPKAPEPNSRDKDKIPDDRDSKKKRPSRADSRTGR